MPCLSISAVLGDSIRSGPFIWTVFNGCSNLLAQITQRAFVWLREDPFVASEVDVGSAGVRYQGGVATG